MEEQPEWFSVYDPVPLSLSHQESQQILNIFIRKRSHQIPRILKWSIGYKSVLKGPDCCILFSMQVWSPWFDNLWRNCTQDAHLKVGEENKQSQNDFLNIVSRIQSNLTGLKPAFAPTLFVLFTDLHELFTWERKKVRKRQGLAKTLLADGQELILMKQASLPLHRCQHIHRKQQY